MAKLRELIRRIIFSSKGRFYPSYAMHCAVRVRTMHDAHLYGKRKTPPAQGRPTMIFMCDADSGVSGGLTDRLRGMVSCYRLCKARGWDFRIYHTNPFRLEDYLAPAAYDWRVDEKDLRYDEATPVFCMNYVGLRSDEFGLRYLSRKMKRHNLIHVYTNIVFSWDDFGARFGELFRPAPELARLIAENKERIGGEYIAAVFRFQQLLGDFYEGGPTRYPTLAPQEQERLIAECLSQLAAVKADHPGVERVLVTSDSVTFLERAAAAFDWVRTIPGVPVHLDYTAGRDTPTYMKSFVDFYMLGGSLGVTLIVGGGMHRSGFPHAAALLGGVKYDTREF